MKQFNAGVRKVYDAIYSINPDFSAGFNQKFVPHKNYGTPNKLHRKRKHWDEIRRKSQHYLFKGHRA